MLWWPIGTPSGEPAPAGSGGRGRSSHPAGSGAWGATNGHYPARGNRTTDTYTETEVRTILESVDDDRLGHACELALSGLRRGEIAGLRWSDIDFDAKTLTVMNNRTDAGGTVTETNPKTATSRRTLPLPDRLATVLRSAKARQARERLALGYGRWEYVVCSEIGEPYSPQVLSRAGARPPSAPGPRDQTARRPAHVRDVDASAGCADRCDRRVDRPQRPRLDDAAVRAQPSRRSQGCWREFGSSCVTVASVSN